MITGRIHSEESFGAVDGPGIRYVLFLAGCPLRCLYCHNADTWKMSNGKEMTVTEVMERVRSYIPFYDASGGGITVSGGEPLLQIDFLTELFKQCKQEGIHTCIDTSGAPFSRRPNFIEKMDTLLEYTDLILLDLKHINSEKHKYLTGQNNEHILDFARYLAENQFPIWVRHVLVPTITDYDEYLHELADFIKTLGNVRKIEVLPYHKLGAYKWEQLGLEYKLKDIESPEQERVENAERILNAALASS